MTNDTTPNDWDQPNQNPAAPNAEAQNLEPAKEGTKAKTPAKKATAKKPEAKKPQSRTSSRGEDDADVKYVDLLTNKDDKDDSEIIKLFQNDDVPPNGQPFGVNGRFFALKADVWYRVPGWLLSTIDNSIHEKPVTDENNRFTGTRPQPRFPYTVHRG